MVTVLTNEELMILNLVKSRLFTPIEIIEKKVFQGNVENARESIKSLVERKMLEYALNNRITITYFGKNATYGFKYI